MFPDPRTKPPAGALLNRSHPHAAGLLAAYVLNEQGPSVYDATGRYNGTVVGAPTRVGSPAGLGLSGFSNSNYVSLGSDIAAAAIAAYPFYMFAIASNSNTTAGQQVMACGSSSSTTPLVGLRYNVSGTGTISWFLRSLATTSSVTSGILPVNDGQAHAVMGVSWSATRHELYFDGRLAASGSTSFALPTVDRMALGVLLRASIDSAFQGTLIAAYVGNGLVPDPASLAAAPFAMFARSTPELYASLTSFRPGWLACTPVLGSGVY